MNTDKVFSPCEMCIIEQQHGEKMCGHCDYHLQKNLNTNLIARQELSDVANIWFCENTDLLLNSYIEHEYTKKDIDISKVKIIPKIYLEKVEKENLYIGADIYIKGLQFIHKSTPPVYLMIIVDFELEYTGLDKGECIYQKMWRFAKENWHYYFDATQESLKKYAEIVGIDESELA